MNELGNWLGLLPALVMLGAVVGLLEVAVRARRRQHAAEEKAKILDVMARALREAPPGSYLVIFKGEYDGELKYRTATPSRN